MSKGSLSKDTGRVFAGSGEPHRDHRTPRFSIRRTRAWGPEGPVARVWRKLTTRGRTRGVGR